MPLKAFKTSERDLNINLSIKTSAIDFPTGFINTAFICVIKQKQLYKPFAQNTINLEFING